MQNHAPSTFCRLPLALTCLALALAAGQTTAQSQVGKVHLTPVADTASFAWKQLASEEKGDVRSLRLPDAKSLAYYHDQPTDVLWLKIELFQPLHSDWFGFNVAVDIDQDPSNGMPWWGSNQGFRFDKLVTGYLQNAGPYYQGQIGVADPEGLGRGILNNLAANNIHVALNDTRDVLMVGIPRKDLGTSKVFDLICTVGSTFLPNDDLPNSGSVQISLASETASPSNPR